jgi:hypothetical protein
MSFSDMKEINVLLIYVLNTPFIFLNWFAVITWNFSDSLEWQVRTR